MIRKELADTVKYSGNYNLVTLFVTCVGERRGVKADMIRNKSVKPKHTTYQIQFIVTD